MIPLGILGQIYAVCAFTGIIFVFANVALGQLDGADDSGGADSGDGGDGGGDYSGEGDSGSSYGADGDSSVNSSGPRLITAVRGNNTGTGFGGMLLGLLSPMTISLYLTFFGATGLVLAYSATWLGFLTIIPSLIVSLMVGGIYKNMIRWMMRNLHSSSHSREIDVIGQIAEVNTPIQGDRFGEVTFVVKSKRINASAKSAKPGVEFKKGSKVLIVQKNDHLVLVEESPDLDDIYIKS